MLSKDTLSPLVCEQKLICAVLEFCSGKKSYKSNPDNLHLALHFDWRTCSVRTQLPTEIFQESTWNKSQPISFQHAALPLSEELFLPHKIENRNKTLNFYTLIFQFHRCQNLSFCNIIMIITLGTKWYCLCNNI